jgi:hypothetical protein
MKSAGGNWARTPQVVRENLGAIDRTVEMILKHLEGGALYVAPRRFAAGPARGALREGRA